MELRQILSNKNILVIRAFATGGQAVLAAPAPAPAQERGGGAFATGTGEQERAALSAAAKRSPPDDRRL